VTCLLKAKIAQPEETAFARQWLYKYFSQQRKKREKKKRKIQ
jgi:hypothetical protein